MFNYLQNFSWPEAVPIRKSSVHTKLALAQKEHDFGLRELEMSILAQFWPVYMNDQSLIKLDSNHMLKSFSHILQSSLFELAFQFKIYAAS